jgi:hypothetical protein
MREGGEMGFFSLVQCQAPDGLDQRRGLGHQAGVVGNAKHPGFAEICHREFGRHLARTVEQPDGVAVDEVERPYRLVVGTDRRCRRAGELMSLGVLDHDRLHCARTPW